MKTAILAALAFFSTVGVPSVFAGPWATGGTITETGGYRIHKFTGSASLSVLFGGQVEVLVVAGGGGGGKAIAGGGGGAGGVQIQTVSITAGVYAVTVGGGGARATAISRSGSPGGNSAIGSLVVSMGGGGGAGFSNGYWAASGGSGGGGNGYTNDANWPGAAGIAGQGNAGGNGTNEVELGNYYGGGGGGASSPGSNGVSGACGRGGRGIDTDISGVLTTYGGGGGGGGSGVGVTAGAGGAGGGGNGSVVGDASAATANTGGGGGGGGGAAGRGGNGGSGIVIVRYRATPNVDNAGGATNVTSTTAVLNGALISTGTTDTAVFVYWGPSDGGTNAGLWANTNRWEAHREPGGFSYPATGLTPDLGYAYRFAATNGAGIDWAPESSVFITGDVWIEKTADASETGPTPGTFTVHRAASATSGALTVNYGIGGTASNGADYATLTGTVTIPAGEETAPIVVLPYLNHLVEPTETVDLTILAGPYVVGSASNASLTIADHGIVRRTWGGGGTNELAGNPDNWTEGTAPEAGTAIVLDGTTNKNMTWNLNVPVLFWTQTDAYSGTVTFAMTYPAYSTTFTNLSIVGDCAISNGVWTQTPNPNSVNAERYRLCITVGGDLFLGSNGVIDVTSKGYYGARMGPGAPPAGANSAGSHGGRGRDISEGNATYEKCYGSIMEPTCLGSSGRDNAAACTGGGAVRLTVGGTLYHDVLIRADANEGFDADNLYAGAGGSVWITAGALVGDGAIQANANKYPGSSGGRGGGGGRVSVVLTNAAADFSAHTGSIQAYGGPDYGAAGTVYLQRGNEPEGCGEIIIDNGGRSRTSVNHATEFLHPPRMPAFPAAAVRIRNNAFLALATNYSLEVSGVWSNSGGFTSRAGSQVYVTDRFSPTTRLYGASTFLGFAGTNGGQTLVFQAGMTNTVSAGGELNLRGDADRTNLVLRSSTPGEFWSLNVSDSAAQSVWHVDAADSDARPGAEILAMFSRDGGNNSNWVFSAVAAGATNVWTGAVGANWSDNGNWSLGRAPTVDDVVRIPVGMPTNPVVDGLARTVAGLELEPGASLSLNGFDFTVDGPAAVAGLLMSAGTETVTFRKAAAVSGTLQASGAETFVLENDADFTGGSFAFASSTVRLSGAAPQSIDPAGLSFHKIDVATTSAVVFTSGFAAYELFAEADGATPRHVSFAPGETAALETMTLVSALGTTNIVLRSAQAGSSWRLVVSVWNTVRGVDVKDSDASGGQRIGAAMSSDSGGNTNWDFAPPWALWTGQTGNGRFEDPANWWPEGVPGADAQVRVDATAPMTITSTVTIASLSVGGGNLAASVTINGELTVGGSAVVGKNGSLLWNRPGVVSNDLIVLSGGLLTHSANAATEVNKLSLAVGGDVTVHANGALDVSGKGHFGVFAGPGGGAGNSGGSYGGRGGSVDTGYLYVSPSLCYGSVVAPTNLGASGRNAADYCAGGGAIRLSVAGVVSNRGNILANAFPVSIRYAPHDNVYSGAGGSIWLSAGALMGDGMIQANSSGFAGSGVRCGGGGGRIALVVTNSGEDLSAFSGPVEAFGGYGYDRHGAAGTVYRQRASDRPGRGIVTVANANRMANPSTEWPSGINGVGGEADRAVFRVADSARLLLTNDCMVGDFWLDTANAILDLGANTLTVNSRQHSLGLGSVTNYGAIVWNGIPSGALIILK